MNSRLECKIMVEGNRRLDLKKKICIGPIRDFDPKNYEKMSIRQIGD